MAFRRARPRAIEHEVEVALGGGADASPCALGRHGRSRASGGGVNTVRLVVELVLAALFPACGRHQPRPPIPRPVQVPRQARRTYHSPTELLAREFPDWRVYAMPSDRGVCFGATDLPRTTTLHAYTVDELRARIVDVERTPPPAFVRRYLTAGGTR
ncbi:hypothetical protein GCM10007147_35980 [Nocardiopsis kunsanensis]|uniref:Uncharacterized protein n=1 Tax=Nocardiopsis kunsanensis TaxID=141693 RepID=A0A918XHJ4_9ACTN|nr:hypothetical protein GCM10007147_35980 [Nocardiopsis kunsanensis]